MATALSTINLLNVSVAPHPFSAARIDKALPVGLSLAEIVRECQPDPLLARHAHVFLGGAHIDPKHWPRIYPKKNTEIVIRMIPMGGGGGKNPLRTVLSLAIAAVSPAIATSVTGLFGSFANASFFGFSIGRLVTGGVNFLGNLLLNALAPPGRPRFSQKESPSLFIQGAQNRLLPFGRVPRVLGKHRMVPPMGAQAYTETVGKDQYLRMLFVWGYGPLQISDLKIGETALSEFEDVETETRQGYLSDAPLTLYSNSVLQNDLQVLLRATDGYILRTTETDAEEISVDITFPRGLLKFGKSGNKTAASVSVHVQYSPKGLNSWSDATAANPTFALTAKQSSALRKSVRWKVAKGQYDVRVKRVTADSADDNTFDEVNWTALRTIRSSYPINMKGLAVTALRIKATDQLNGVIDRFNGIAQSLLPDWNGSSWVEQPTSNPASLFRHVLQGSANARPLADSRLDLGKLQAWHDRCAAAGHEFNAVIDYDVSAREILQDVAAAGRASPALIDGKWAVIEDRVQTVPVQHFTPRNTFGFKGQKAFDELPHALRVRFINRDKGWLQDERLVFDDGYTQATATRYETLELAGNTALVTGTTTITSFGASASTARPIFFVRFSGALTLTHNATSLILPSSANITTANGDTCIAEYLGSGNWKVLGYFRVSGNPVNTGTAGATVPLLNAANTFSAVTTFSAGAYSFAATLADDTATSYKTPAATGTFILSCGGTSSTNPRGFFHCRTTTALLERLDTAPTQANVNLTTGALTGTTGTDAKFTLSAHSDGKLYFENRSGGTITITLLFVPGA